MSGMAHFFMSVGGSKFHERLAHFFIDIYRVSLLQRLLLVHYHLPYIMITRGKTETPAKETLSG